ncbi:hypothetical protein VaNZ11_001608 [Volvox africanus]|uniref:Uncharacterized protein n=1 Tax=Volvox africanus TaxID=51714 RepID=A0ABQ5RQE3_9CHLO|nr:hypothetical protein VaNZ11_001608 [Volvox africanus]
MGPAHVFELFPDRGRWFWMLLGRGKTIHLQGRTRNQPYRGVQAPAPAPAMHLGGTTGANDSMRISPPCSQPDFELDAADSQKCNPGLGLTRVSNTSTSTAPSKVQIIKLVFADLAMIACQLLLFVNHFRRLKDAECPLQGLSLPADAKATHGPGSPAPDFLSAYPCTASITLRIAFLVGRADRTFRAAFKLPPGELWVPLVTSVILAQLLALLVMPRGMYIGFGRRTFMLLVGLLPKAVSLATFITAPHERPSSYFSTYLPIEGAITIWQHVVYNYPFWPGIGVLAVHCALSTAICATVAPRLQPAGAAPLFNAAWVMVHMYCCVALAVYVALQQHPAAGQEIRAVLRAGAATGRAVTVWLRRWWCSNSRCHYADADIKLGLSSGSGSGITAFLEAEVNATAADFHSGKASFGFLPSDLQAAGSSIKSGACSTSFTASSLSSSSSSLEPSETGSTTGSGSHSAIAAAMQFAHQASLSARGAVEVAVATESQPSKPDTGAVRIPRAVVLGCEQGAGLPTSAKLMMMAARVQATGTQSTVPAADLAARVPSSSSGAGVGPPTPYVPRISGSGRASAAVAPLQPFGTLPPTGAFSLKQPTGLSKWTIVEDQEFQAPSPAAVGMRVGAGSSVEAVGHIFALGSRFPRYRSRAPRHRVHMKLPWAEPDQLPGNFLERLNLALSEGLDCMAVGVAVRAGCIELIFDLVPQAAFDSASDYQAGQSRRRHAQQHQPNHHGLDMSPRADAAAVQRQQQAAAPPQQVQQVQQVPDHLDLLVQLGADGLPGGEGDELSDPHSALEAAVLSGLLSDGEPSSWIDALHLQPPPGAKVLTQACGRVWISRWDHILRQWIPERAGGIRPSQLPRITQLRPSCVHRAPLGSGSGAAAAAAAVAPGGGRFVVPELVGAAAPAPAFTSTGGSAPARAGGCGAVVRVTVSNGDGSTPPAFSARCRGRYLPVIARRVRTTPSDAGAAAAAVTVGGGCESDDLATFEVEMEPEALPRNGLVVVECKVGKLLSNWRPLIVTEDPQLAQELELLPVRLPGAPEPSSSSLDSAATGTTATAPPSTAFDQYESSNMSFAVSQPRLTADGGSDGAATATATATASVADTEGDAFCWDELHSDLGLWLDYLEVLGLSATGSSSSSSIAEGIASAIEPAAEGLAVAEPGADGNDTGHRCGKSSENRDQNGSKEAAAGAVDRAPDSLDMGPGLAALYSTEGYRAHMAGIGVSLLEFAVDQGWVHVTGMLVDQMLAAGITWPEILRRCSGGLTLLHRSVRSGRGPMVDLVVRLGERQGTPFDWQAVCLQDNGKEGEIEAVAVVEEPTAAEAAASGGGAGGVTPLHSAASLPDGGQLAERILSEYEAACELWALTTDSHGVRPADCAHAFGSVHLAERQRARPDGGSPAPAKVPLLPSAVSEPSNAGGASTTTATSGVMTGPGLNKEVDDNGGDGGGSGKVRSAAVRCHRGGILRSGLAAVVAVLRGLMQVMAAPFVGDPREEAAYVRAVGSDNVLWCCGYLVYQICVVLAVAGRMVKELRAHEMAGMMMFCTPHIVSAALLCVNYGAWLRAREALFAIVTVSRSLAKLFPVLGLLPYPASASNYLSGGMDVLLEGVVPAFFERMRAPFVLPLRALEGLATGLLYRSHHVELHLAPAGVSDMAYALAWTLGCGAITVALDVGCRRRLASALGSYSAGSQAAESPTRSVWDSSLRPVERGPGPKGVAVVSVPAEGGLDGNLMRKKVV